MPTTSSASPRKKIRLSRAQAHQLLPTGIGGIKTFRGQDFQDQVYDDVPDKGWKVRYLDNSWKELTRQEMESFVR